MDNRRSGISAVAGSAADRARGPVGSSDLLEAVPDVVACTSPQGLVRYVSPAARSLLGLDPRCLVGRHAYELVHPEDVLTVARAQGQTRASTGTTTTLHRVRRGDGSFGWFETTARARRDPVTGAVVDLVSVTRDAAARVETERRLADSASYHRVALDAQDCGVVVLGPDAKLAMANTAAERLLGVGRADLVGRRLLDVVQVSDETGRPLRSSELACAEAQRTGRACSRTLAMIRGDDTVAVLHTHAQPVRSPVTGEVEQVVLTLVEESARPGRVTSGTGDAVPAPRPRVPAGSVGLTPRELEVLSLLAAGRGTTAAARDLGVSVNTVRGHVKNLLAKLGAHSQVEAVVTALRRGILTLD